MAKKTKDNTYTASLQALHSVLDSVRQSGTKKLVAAKAKVVAAEKAVTDFLNKSKEYKKLVAVREKARAEETATEAAEKRDKEKAVEIARRQMRLRGASDEVVDEVERLSKIYTEQDRRGYY